MGKNGLSWLMKKQSETANCIFASWFFLAADTTHCLELFSLYITILYAAVWAVKQSTNISHSFWGMILYALGPFVFWMTVQFQISTKVLYLPLYFHKSTDLFSDLSRKLNANWRLLPYNSRNFTSKSLWVEASQQLNLILMQREDNLVGVSFQWGLY